MFGRLAWLISHCCTLISIAGPFYSFEKKKLDRKQQQHKQYFNNSILGDLVALDSVKENRKNKENILSGKEMATFTTIPPFPPPKKNACWTFWS